MIKRLVLDVKALVVIGAAKGAFVVRAAQGGLDKDAVGLAGRPDAVAHIMEAGGFAGAFHGYLSPKVQVKSLCRNIWPVGAGRKGRGEVRKSGRDGGKESRSG